MLLWMLIACGSPPTLTCPECPTCPVAPPPPLALDDWEVSMLKPRVEALRVGLQLKGDRGLGACRGRGRCERFLGPEAGELEPGDYYLRAEVQPPDIGTGWSVRFTVHCDVTTAGVPAKPIDYQQTWTVPSQAATQGYRIEPLWRIHSPAKAGSRRCTYSIQGLRPDGQPGKTFTGSYAVP